jgi:hypothetical protein
MSNTPEAPQEEKTFVDEDGKAQAQVEKETHPRPEPAEPAEPAGATAGPLPPPSLEFLASTLAMQAMICLGLIANPVTGKAEFQPEQAKHLIDMIQMLRDKTEGNRTADETATLEHLLHELRLGFVAVQEKAKTQGAG